MADHVPVSSEGNPAQWTVRIHLQACTSAIAASRISPRKDRNSQFSADFDTIVDGLTGDAYIRSLNARFLHTQLRATGSVLRAPDGKTESLEVTGDHARIEDLLLLFTKTMSPSLSGPIRLHASICLPPGPQHFLKSFSFNVIHHRPRRVSPPGHARKDSRTQPARAASMMRVC